MRKGKTPSERLIELQFQQSIESILQTRFDEGRSLEEIGEELGVSWATVRVWSRKYHMPRRKPGPRPAASSPNAAS